MFLTESLRTAAYLGLVQDRGYMNDSHDVSHMRGYTYHCNSSVIYISPMIHDIHTSCIALFVLFSIEREKCD